MKKLISLLVIALTVVAFAGCNQKETVDTNVSVKDIVENIKAKMAEDMIAGGMPEENLQEGNVPGYMEIDLTADSEENLNLFGDAVNKDDIAEGIVFEQMINVNSNLIIVLKAKDESSVENVKASLDEVKAQQENIWSTYLPDQYEKVKNTIIKNEGLYFIYITYEDPESIETIFDNTIKGTK